MLKGLTPPEKEYVCAFIRTAADKLDKDDYKFLEENLADTRWNHANLASALNERGFKCYADQVRLHRTGRCICA